MNTKLRKCAIGCTVVFVLFNAIGCKKQSTPPKTDSTHIKLNTVVTQLLKVEQGPEEAHTTEYEFDNPREGWIFITSTSNGIVNISIANTKPDGAAIVHDPTGKDTIEAMRYLKAGKYFIRTESKNKCSLSMTVRTMPEIQFALFEYQPWLYSFGPYDPEYIQKNMLDNVNCVLSNPDRLEDSRIYIDKWRNAGKRWIVCRPGGDDPLKTITPGIDDGTDGMIIDELLNSHVKKKDVMQNWTDTILQVSKTGQLVYPYYGGVKPEKELSIAFTKIVIEQNQKVAWEVYLAEKPTEQEAREYMTEKLKGNLGIWEKNIPGSTTSVIIALGAMVMNTAYTTAGNPEVDWKYFIDMQHNLIVNDPAFEGLAGIQHYTSGYMNDEYMRWTSLLNRHYYIEGNTEMLSDKYGFKYKLDHIENPDFENGTAGWQIKAAEEGSVAAKQYEDYHRLQGRHGTGDIGNTFLWTKRSDKAPNIITQQIKNLTPGKLYSLKLIAGDFDELKAGNSDMKMEVGGYEEFIAKRVGLKTKAVSVNVNAADIIEDKSFVEARPSHYSSTLNGFNRTNRYMFNFHYIVFRAKRTTAELVITDWKNATEPGGPKGQEMIYNFVEVQPYFDK